MFIKKNNDDPLIQTFALVVRWFDLQQKSFFTEALVKYVFKSEEVIVGLNIGTESPQFAVDARVNENSIPEQLLEK